MIKWAKEKLLIFNVKKHENEEKEKARGNKNM